MRMTTYLARERQNVFVEMEELDKCISSPIDTDTIVGVSAWSACAHERRRRFVAMKRKKTTTIKVFWTNCVDGTCLCLLIGHVRHPDAQLHSRLLDSLLWWIFSTTSLLTAPNSSRVSLVIWTCPEVNAGKSTILSVNFVWSISCSFSFSSCFCFRSCCSVRVCYDCCWWFRSCSWSCLSFTWGLRLFLFLLDRGLFEPSTSLREHVEQVWDDMTRVLCSDLSERRRADTSWMGGVCDNLCATIPTVMQGTIRITDPYPHADSEHCSIKFFVTTKCLHNEWDECHTFHHHCRHLSHTHARPPHSRLPPSTTTTTHTPWRVAGVARRRRDGTNTSGNVRSKAQNHNQTRHLTFAHHRRKALAQNGHCEGIVTSTRNLGHEGYQNSRRHRWTLWRPSSRRLQPPTPPVRKDLGGTRLFLLFCPACGFSISTQGITGDWIAATSFPSWPPKFHTRLSRKSGKVWLTTCPCLIQGRHPAVAHKIVEVFLALRLLSTCMELQGADSVLARRRRGQRSGISRWRRSTVWCSKVRMQFVGSSAVDDFFFQVGVWLRRSDARKADRSQNSPFFAVPLAPLSRLDALVARVLLLGICGRPLDACSLCEDKGSRAFGCPACAVGGRLSECQILSSQQAAGKRALWAGSRVHLCKMVAFLSDTLTGVHNSIENRLWCPAAPDLLWEACKGESSTEEWRVSIRESAVPSPWLDFGESQSKQDEVQTWFPVQNRQEARSAKSRNSGTLLRRHVRKHAFFCHDSRRSSLVCEFHEYYLVPSTQSVSTAQRVEARHFEQTHLCLLFDLVLPTLKAPRCGFLFSTTVAISGTC